MRRWLLAAGIYNLLWGALVVVAPDVLFRLSGLDPLPSPGRALWQCLGMVIGVYGIGYLAASLDPLRHWPIVLVGLLGKVCGPVGFAWSASRGEIPWSFGAMLLLNDVLWWAPFFLILRATWLHARAATDGSAPDHGALAIGSALCIARDQHGNTLAELSRQRPVLLVSVRHFGCTFCGATLAQLAHDRAAIQASGVTLALLHPAHAEAAAPFILSAGLSDLPCFADPQGCIARSLGLRCGTFAQLFGPRAVLRAVPALLRGHRIGYPVGDPLQMPGAFLIHRGRLVRHHHHAHAGQKVDYLDLATGTRLDSGPAAADTVSL